MIKFLIQLALLTVPTIATAQTADTKPLRVGLSDFRSPHQHSFSRAAEKQGVTATLVYEQLPDMLTPRIGHQTFVSNKDLIVVGVQRASNSPPPQNDMQMACGVVSASTTPTTVLSS